MAALGTDSEEMQFELKYDGPALITGTMSARDLGPAILGVGTMLERASEIVYGPGGKVTVEVRADFRHGSFEIDFRVLQQAGEALSLLGSDAAENIFILLFGASSPGVIGMIRKWWKGKQEEEEQSAEDHSATQGGITIDARGSTDLRVQILQDPEVRRGIADIAAPLQKPGIESVSFSVQGKYRERITDDELPAFSSPVATSRIISTDISMPVIKIAVVNFAGQRRWRFIYQNSEFAAPILDERFLARVKNGTLRFTAETALKVHAEITTVQEQGELKYHWKILEVLDVIDGDNTARPPLLEAG